MCENSDLNYPFVSVVIPIKNEEKYIKSFIQTLKKQSYPKDKMEIIFCDGNSSDNTLKCLKEFVDEKILDVIVLNNDKENAPSGVNLGIKKSKGDIIVRLDAHTFYPKEYIEKNVYHLINSDADNVGCPINTVGEGINGKAIAYICSSKFGVGNSKFRTSNYTGYVDTVPFGCFRKDLINKIGYFDENLPRSEDNDFNYRIRKYGGKILMFSEIFTEYHSRNTILSLCKMGFHNGKGIIELFKKEKNAIDIRHFIPFLFVLGNLIGVLLILLNIYFFKEIYLFFLLIYFILDILYSFKELFNQGLIVSVICIIAFPLFHLCYGLGSLSNVLTSLEKGDIDG